MNLDAFYLKVGHKNYGEIHEPIINAVALCSQYYMEKSKLQILPVEFLEMF